MTDVPPNPAPNPAPAPKPWHDGKLSAEELGYLQNRAMADKPAEEVAISSIKAHREAMKLIGVPETELLRLPKEANDPAWRNVYQRLGAPATDKEYDFAGVKFSNDEALDEGFVATVRDLAFKSNLTKQQALDVTRGFVKYMEGEDANEAGEKAVKLTQEKEALAKNWGPNAPAHKLVAERAAQALGVKKEELDALESVVGYSRVMEMFRSVGEKIGEAKFISSNTPSGAMTREQATERLAGLMADPVWTAKLLNKDAAVLREHDDLTRMKVGV